MWYKLIKESDLGYRNDYFPDEGRINKRDVTEELISKMYNAHRSGMSIDEVGRQFGIRPETVSENFRNYDLKTKKINPTKAYAERANYLFMHERGLCERIVQMYDDGVSIPQLSVDPKINMPSVIISHIIKLVKNEPMAGSMRRISKDDISKMLAAFRGGSSIGQISKLVGMPHRTVMKYIMDNIDAKEKDQFRRKLINQRGFEFGNLVEEVKRYFRNNPSRDLRNAAQILGISPVQLRDIKSLFLD